ncbi:hypothetical protein LX36DRAFT_657177 [Colletotrichum falcatum]|nr:hypothetical protein LX36DRAFT_657177 [Colletotrichum falcatum]
MLPPFYLAGEYTKAAAEDPLAPLPLPPDESSVSVIVATLPAFRFLLRENRNMTRKTTNKYVGPKSGGSGAVRLDGGDNEEGRLSTRQRNEIAAGQRYRKESRVRDRTVATRVESGGNKAQGTGAVCLTGGIGLH